MPSLFAASAAFRCTVGETRRENLPLNPTYPELFPYIIPSYILMFALIIPQLALYWRRLHDTGKSGLFFLLYLIPVAGFIIMIVFCCQESDVDNIYGPRKTE